MTNIASSKRLGLLLLIASSSLSLIQGDAYCGFGVACDGDAQGGTWCNENEDNCEDCGGNWCADESDSTIDNVEDVTQYENDGEYSKYMTDFEDLSSTMNSEEKDLDSEEDLPAMNEDPAFDKGRSSFQNAEKDSDKGGQQRYIVKFKDTPEGLARARRMESRALEEQLIDILPEDNAEVLQLKEEEVYEWEERDDVEYVEKDQKVYLSGESTPYGINMVKASSVSDDSVSNRKVCIIDSGYDINHPDLPKGSVVTGTNGRKSWNQDTDGHGTHVAGTIAAVGGNGKGVVGVVRNGKMKLHIIRVFGDPLGGGRNEWVWTSDVVGAAEECQRVGSNVVNMSLGRLGGPSQFEKDAYQRMYNEGMLLVAAAGNNANEAYSYPASYDAVMSVAAVDSSKSLAWFSQRNDQVDVAAPGVGVRSTIPGGGYGNKSGTSMASPHVAGVAALVWSYVPDKSAQEIREALEKTAEDLGANGRDNSFGHGLVQADRAIEFLKKSDGSTNVAYGKSTLQSSTGWSGSSSRAVDGNVSGNYWHNSVTHTNLQSNPWWRVYLQAVYKIDSIFIYNRQDCCSDRLSNFKVDVLRGESVVWSYTYSGMPGYHTAIDVPGTVNGDSVKVSLPGSGTKYLSLAEVQVWASSKSVVYELAGSTYATCQGKYTPSSEYVGGKLIWDRTTGSRFIFKCARNGHWCITGSQWRQDFIDGKITHCGAFVCSRNSANEWFEADWSNNNGARVEGA